MNVVRGALGTLVASAVITISIFARADTLPTDPDVDACRGSAHPVGSGCETTKAETGICSASACSDVIGEIDSEDGGGICKRCVAATPTRTVCITNAVACDKKSVGYDCVLANGASGNCGTVNCSGVPTLSCIEGKGSDEGGCNVGAADVGSSFAVLALLAPFAGLRLTRRKRRGGGRRVD